MAAQKYDFEKIENKWKNKWYEDNICEAKDFDEKPKKYILAELPYPSGYALHAGHMMRYTVPEVYSRYLRMNGYNVMFPMGWDAFGLPAETFAIETGTHPSITTKKAIKSFKDSLIRMGYGIDWSREFSTADPENYKWTQWMFLKLWKSGLAEKKETPVWWCEKLKTVLAEEEVITDKDGNKISERKEHPVERIMFNQWVLKIPKYAEKLLDGLDEVDFTDSIKTAQRNWIGKSEGAIVTFEALGNKLEVFTTRPDTLYGTTFLVLAPEHPLVNRVVDKAENPGEIKKYVKKAKNKSDLERQISREKTGVQIKGLFAKHPFDDVDLQIPIFVADYVLMDYGTGSIMGVPAHDERDFEFAKKHNLKIIEIIKPESPTNDKFFVGHGIMINSGKYNGIKSEDFIKKAISLLEKTNKGRKETTYKIRDQIFSRQRYWGEPIPMIYRKDGSLEPIVDPDNLEEVNKKLPLVLPDVPDYKPTSGGLSPLAKNKKWTVTTDSSGNEATRETDTMPTWAGSNWYFIRYIDPKNNKCFADMDKLKYWLPVDKYFGGIEHTTMHLLYSRFWYRFLYDQNIVPTPEPYSWRLNGGMLLGSDGRKMSKSYNNTIDPMNIVNKYGADATRMYVCFLGPYTDTYPWIENGVKSCLRLVRTIYEFKNSVSDKKDHNDVTKLFHKTVKNITNMCENIKMNTAVSQLMIFTNKLRKVGYINKNTWKEFIKLIAPFAPFVAEDLWQDLNGFKKWNKKNSVHLQTWPKFDKKLIVEDEITLPIQINGKIRDTVIVGINTSEDEVKKVALESKKIQKYVSGKKLKKTIYVKGRILNFVV